MHGAEMDDKQILVELVNLDSTDEAVAQAFVDRHGPLKKGESAIYVGQWAQIFRKAWEWKQLKAHEIDRLINMRLDEIFKAAEPTLENLYERPALRADFMAGKWKPEPRYLLDRLALELMRSRKMLHVCENPECGRLFIKAFSRDRYCSIQCGEKMRGIGQREWAKKNREEINRRRRKPIKKRRTA